MVVKRRPLRSPTRVQKEEVVEMGSDKPKENQRPPVTQVVEVVEDQDQSESVTAVADSGMDSELLEEAADRSDPENETAASGHEHHGYNHPHHHHEKEVAADDDAEEKRRVLVDELFQKKEPVESDVMPEISAHRKSSKRSILVWAFVVILTSIVAGVVIMMLSGKNLNVGFPAFGPTPTPSPTMTPTPAPTPDVTKLDRSELSVQVLNGSGTPGAAGKMKSALEKSGYTVEDTANAESYDYKETEIIVKEDKKDYIPLLEDDLKKLYTLAPSVATLDEDVPYDVRIIVGKEE